MRPAWESDGGVSGQRLILPAELEDGRVPHLLGRLSYLFSGLILCAIVWASFAEIRERAVAHGQIVPVGSVQQVQHLEGGQIERVLVREGQSVAKDAPLIELRPAAAESDLGQLSARAAGLRLQEESLAALIQSRRPDFGVLARRFPALAAQQAEAFASKAAHRAQERRTLQSRVAQRGAEIAAIEKELVSLGRQIEIQREQLKIRGKLLESGYASRRAYLESEVALEQAKVRTFSTAGRLETAREQLAEAYSLLQAADADALRTLTEERSKVSAELVELEQQMGKHRDRVDRLVVRAPVRGIVQELAPRAPGEVIKPGDLVAKIVPANREIVAEVKLDPGDIGHVAAGDPAEIKVSTFDHNVFGVVEGTVDRLSATTFEAEDGTLYYKAVITLARSHVGTAASKRTIHPGMVVQADIISGSKSLVKYLLKPVYRSLDAGFTER